MGQARVIENQTWAPTATLGVQEGLGLGSDVSISPNPCPTNALTRHQQSIFCATACGPGPVLGSGK